MSTLAEALAPRSDQLNADDLIPGPRILKITGARILKDGRDTKVVLNYEGDNGKPWKPCKTMGRAMVIVWAVTDEQQMVGKSVRVYRDPEVKFGDQGAVGGIRVSHMSHIDKPSNVKLTVSQGKKSLFTFHPLVTDAGTQAKRQTPEEWTDEYVGKVRATTVTDALIALQSRSANALARLKADHPALHERAVQAGVEQAAKLAPAHEPEGRDDHEMGEGFTNEPDPFATSFEGAE